jgi:hypothetical protein
MKSFGLLGALFVIIMFTIGVVSTLGFIIKSVVEYNELSDGVVSEKENVERIEEMKKYLPDGVTDITFVKDKPYGGWVTYKYEGHKFMLYWQHSQLKGIVRID